MEKSEVRSVAGETVLINREWQRNSTKIQQKEIQKLIVLSEIRANNLNLADHWCIEALSQNLRVKIIRKRDVARRHDPFDTMSQPDSR